MEKKGYTSLQMEAGDPESGRQSPSFVTDVPKPPTSAAHVRAKAAGSAGKPSGSPQPSKEKIGLQNILICAGLAAVLIILIVMAAVYQTPTDMGPEYVPCIPANDTNRCLVVNPEPYLDRDFRNLSRRLEAANGIVVADQSRCSEIGAAVLKEGGNAVDAAVATAFCQGVVNPFASGIGGGAFIMVRNGTSGNSTFINAREFAPGNASADMYDERPYAAYDGGLSIAVPLELRGLRVMWERWGTLSWSRLVLPAAALASEGYAAHPYLVYILGPGNMHRVKESPALRDAFLIKVGSEWRAPRVGELCCRRPQLAATLERIAREGVDWVYAQPTAEVLAAEIQAAGGIITADDLVNAKVDIIPDPPSAQVGRHTLVYPPVPSSGPVVALALRMLAGFGDSARGAPADAAAKQVWLHRTVEALKHAFALRMWLGDPNPQAQPPADITAVLKDINSDAFVESLRRTISDEHVANETSYGGKWNPYLNDIYYQGPEHGTSHFCVVDAQRSSVAITTTVNTAFGSAVVSPSTGILFNNEMDDFSLPGRKNWAGLHPTLPNYIAPYKRPLSSMTPCFAYDTVSGNLTMVAGASGGPLIVSATLQSLLRVLLFGEDPFTAVMGPRVHNQFNNPDMTWGEALTWGHVNITLDADQAAFLTKVGDKLIQSPFTGNSDIVAVQQGTGLLVGVSDVRKDGAPAGY